MAAILSRGRWVNRALTLKHEIGWLKDETIMVPTEDTYLSMNVYVSIQMCICRIIDLLYTASPWWKQKYVQALKAGIADLHDDVIKWKHFPRNWPFVRGIHRSPVNSPHKGQWRGALMISLICVWINDWVNNRKAGDLRRYRAHYDVIVVDSFVVAGDTLGCHNYNFRGRRWRWGCRIWDFLVSFTEW